MTQIPANLSSEKIKFLRKDNGWSQDLLAKASGLSLRTIQRAEKEGNSSTETKLALAAAFNISPNELDHVSSKLDVNWKRKNIMQSLLALLVVTGAITLLFVLAGELNMFADIASALYLALFMYSGTVIAFGAHGLVKSFTGMKYLFASDISPTAATCYLADIYKKQITFVYGGALVGLLIGSVAIHTNVSEEIVFHRAYAVNLLVLLYAAIFSEGLLRPLATKLEARELTTHLNKHQPKP